MKIIALEEHCGLPVIYEAAHKANDRLALAYDVLKKTGKFKESKTGFPAGIYDLGEGRIAAASAFENLVHRLEGYILIAAVLCRLCSGCVRSVSGRQ
jgi:hypothetical protein